MVQRLRFKKIDAFVLGESSGNPAACVYLSGPDELSPDGMQQVARELAGFVSEVVYIYPEENMTTLRYFSSECEVAFCGHGTIAAMHDLIKSDNDLLQKPIIPIKVGGRQLLVRNELAQADSVFISAPSPVVLEMHIEPNEIAQSLRISPGEIVDPGQISFINGGLKTLLVPLKSLSGLLGTCPDQAQLRKFCIKHGIDIILIHTAEVARHGSDYRTRVFAPVFGYLEDPATGSGNSAFGYYLLAAGKWDGRMLTVEQGKSKDCPNIVKLVSDASEHQRTVYFGGNAVARIEGEYLLVEIESGRHTLA